MKLSTFLLVFLMIGLITAAQVTEDKDPHCKTIYINDPDYTGCKICDTGYGRKEGKLSTARILTSRTLQTPKKNMICIACSMPYCTNCNDRYDSCTTCKDGYFPNQKQVSTNLKFYKERLLQETIKVCYKCVSPCKNCTSKDTCLSCIPRYTFFENKCQKCTPEHCLNCDKNINICQECDKRYFQKDGKCQSCIKNCNVCENATTCKECFLDYTFKEGECKKKPFFKRFWVWFWIILGLIIVGLVVLIVMSKNKENDNPELAESLK